MTRGQPSPPKDSSLPIGPLVLSLVLTSVTKRATQTLFCFTPSFVAHCRKRSNKLKHFLRSRARRTKRKLVKLKLFLRSPSARLRSSQTLSQTPTRKALQTHRVARRRPLAVFTYFAHSQSHPRRQRKKARSSSSRPACLRKSLTWTSRKTQKANVLRLRAKVVCRQKVEVASAVVDSQYDRDFVEVLPKGASATSRRSELQQTVVLSL